MRKPINRTGPFGIGSMVHVVHVSDNIHQLNKWYEDVFGGVVFNGADTPGYMAQEKRWASLVLVSDYCIETMAPELPVDRTTPIGRFFDRGGRRFHSLAWTAVDVETLLAHMKEQGVPCVLTDTGRFKFFFTSPRYTSGLMVEFISDEMPEDPRRTEAWSSLRKHWLTHPLGVQGVSHITVAVTDLDAAVQMWSRLWSPLMVATGRDRIHCADAAWMVMGDTLVELARPIQSSGLLAEHAERFGGSLFSVSLAVENTRRAETYLNDLGIRTTRVADGAILADPRDSFGAIYLFADRSARDQFVPSAGSGGS